MKRLDPALNSGSDQYIDGNANTGVGGTVLQAEALNHLQEEVAHVIESGGGVLNPNSKTQLLTKIQAIASAAAGGGTATIPATEKGAANGVATLDGNGQIPAAQIPALALERVYPVANQAAMLALANVQEGDVAKIANGDSYMLYALPASNLANWIKISSSLVLDATDTAKGISALNQGNAANDDTNNTDALTAAGFNALALAGNNNALIQAIKAAVAPPTVNCEYVLSGGAGAGGDGSSTGYGGGGAAGGYRTNVPGQMSGGGQPAEPAMSLLKGTTNNVVIGAGGSKVYVTKGGDTTFNGITALGGGVGGNSGLTVTKNGGSGGGGNNGIPAAGIGTAGQGYNGGAGSASYDSGAGGGGAGGVGGSVTAADVGGNGGPGVSSNITGTSVTRNGGGAGYGANGNGTGGAGGGGTPGTSPDGAANTGSGGAGFSYGGGSGQGGSGYAYFRFLASAGVTGGTMTTVGAYTVHYFPTSGSLTIPA